MTVFAIEYQYSPTSEDIATIRPVHREFLKDLKDRGILIGSGPYTEGNGGALIIIQLEGDATVDTAEQLMNNDPFYAKGALAGRTIHMWNPVLNIFGV